MKFLKLISILVVFFAFINSLKVNDDNKKSQITNLNNNKSLDTSKNDSKNIKEEQKQTMAKQEKTTKVNEKKINEIEKLKSTKVTRQNDEATNASDNSSSSSSDTDIDQNKPIEHLTATYIDNTKKPNKDVPYNEVPDKTKADIQIPKDPVATPEEELPSFSIDDPNLYRKSGTNVKAVERVKAKNETTASTNTTDSELAQNIKANEYVTPKIESLGPKEPRYEFEPVQYVKQISPAGKAALELQNSGEYIIFNKALTISSF